MPFSIHKVRTLGVELRYDKRRFCLRIRDKGKGIDTNVLAEWAREGHYGLRGMRERADLIGGNLNVRSEPDAGTEVELTIAASHAYAKARAARNSTPSVASHKQLELFSRALQADKCEIIGKICASITPVN